MKLTITLLIAALAAPVTLAFGLSVAAVSATATGFAVSSIAIDDYAKKTCNYHKALAKRTERHPLAA